jgi:hypothetical protein
MPTAEFSDDDIINAIIRTTGYKPTIILKKEFDKAGRLIVIWR